MLQLRSTIKCNKEENQQKFFFEIQEKHCSKI